MVSLTAQMTAETPRLDTGKAGDTIVLWYRMYVFYDLQELLRQTDRQRRIRQ